jgi:putative ABC transport system substrate-binding protein
MLVKMLGLGKLPKRATFAASLSLLVAAMPLSGCSEKPQTEKARVVILTPLPFDILDQSIAGLKEGLAKAGYGSANLELREVNAGGQMQLLSGYAREIAASRPDVIVSVSTPATEAVLGAARADQNIVFSTVTDPAKAKVPPRAGNVTGVSDVVNYQANVDLLQELFPQARRVGTIYNPSDDAAVHGIAKVKPIFAAKGIELVVIAASSSNEAVSAARTLAGKVDAIYVGSDSNAAAAMPGIVSVALAKRTPVIASDAGSVRNGALAAVSVDYKALGRAGADLVVRVLRSGKPAGEIPRVAFVGSDLVLNAETARRLGYAFPAPVLTRKPQIVRQKS